MKKAILLLHGLKENNVDDFEELIDFFKSESDYEICNESYFDLKDKKTLTHKSFEESAKKIADKMKEYDEVKIIAYSFGTFIADQVALILGEEKVSSFYSLVPPIKIHMKRWITYFNKKRKLRKKVIKVRGKEYKKKIKQMQKEQKQSREKNMSKLILSIWTFGIKKRRQLYKRINIDYLFAEDDNVVITDWVVNKLNKKKYNSLTIKDFHHYEITRKDKQIFIDWYKSIKD